MPRTISTISSIRSLRNSQARKRLCRRQSNLRKTFKQQRRKTMYSKRRRRFSRKRRTSWALL